MRKLILVLFLCVFLFVVGCNNKGENLNVEESNKEQSDLIHDYINDALNQTTFNFSDYYMRCNYSKEIINNHIVINYYAYYFNHDGTTRKACHSHTDNAGLENKSIVDCSIEVNNKIISFNSINEKYTSDSGYKYCNLYKIDDELETNFDFNINDYPKIKKIYEDFAIHLKNNTVYYSYVELKNSLYADGTYKTVTIYINKKEKITFKFDNNENLMLVNLNGNISNFNSIDYENSRQALISFDYFNFSHDEQLKISNLFVNDGNMIINNYEISQTSGINLFLIEDNRYK